VNFQKYAKALAVLEKKGESRHNKYFDTKSGKFVTRDLAAPKKDVGCLDKEDDERRYGKTKDQKVLVQAGNALGRMEAEIDLMIFDYEKGDKKQVITVDQLAKVPA